MNELQLPSSPLLRLPTELRLEIYSHLCSQEWIPVASPDDGLYWCTWHLHSNLLLVCRQMKVELEDCFARCKKKKSSEIILAMKDNEKCAFMLPLFLRHKLQTLNTLAAELELQDFLPSEFSRRSTMLVVIEELAKSTLEFLTYCLIPQIPRKPIDPNEIPGWADSIVRLQHFLEYALEYMQQPLQTRTVHLVTRLDDTNCRKIIYQAKIANQLNNSQGMRPLKCKVILGWLASRATLPNSNFDDRSPANLRQLQVDAEKQMLREKAERKKRGEFWLDDAQWVVTWEEDQGESPYWN